MISPLPIYNSAAIGTCSIPGRSPCWNQSRYLGLRMSSNWSGTAPADLCYDLMCSLSPAKERVSSVVGPTKSGEAAWFAWRVFIQSEPSG